MGTRQRPKLRTGVTLLSAMLMSGCASSGASLWGGRGATASVTPGSRTPPVAARGSEVRSASALASADSARDAAGRRRQVATPPGATWDGGLRIEDGTPSSAADLAGEEGSLSVPRNDSEWESIAATAALDRATVLELRGDLDAARAAYDQALASSPRDLRTVVSCARFADRHGQGPRAAELYLRALELPDGHPVVWSEAGLCLSRHGFYEPGLAACRRAATAAPDNPRFREQLLAAERCHQAERVAAMSPASSSVSFIAEPTRPGADSAPDFDGAVPSGATFTSATPASLAANSAYPATSPDDMSAPGRLDDANSSDTPPRPLPFAPGSTARQFERPFPKVSKSRSSVSGEWLPR